MGKKNSIIHPSLSIEGVRFCLVPKENKRPFEKAWQLYEPDWERQPDGGWKNKHTGRIYRTGKERKVYTGEINNYTITSKKLHKHTQNGGNYGIVCGYADVVVIDADTPDFQKIIDKHLPDTFKVQTSKEGCCHNYFICKDVDKKYVFENSKWGHSGELQYKGTQVIGPGSIHPSKKVYTPINNKEITTIDKKKLLLPLIEFMKNEDKNNMLSYQQPSYYGRIEDEIKQQVQLIDLMQEYGYDLNKNPTMCKLGHTSRGKSCFSYNDQDSVWHCFHCKKGGDIFNFMMEHENISFVNAKKILAERVGIDTTKFQINFVKQISEFDKEQSVEAIRNRIFALIVAKKRLDAIELLYQFVLQKYNLYTVRSDTQPEMWYYINGIYIPEGRTYCEQIIKEVLQEGFTEHFCNLVIKNLQIATYITSADFFGNVNPNKIAVENGILNLQTFELEPFSPDEIFFNKLPVHYNPKTDCPNIKKHIIATLRTQEDRDALQELFGYLLVRDYRIHKAFLFSGEGRNGKGITFNIIEKFVGKWNCSNISLHRLVEDRFAKSELLNIMVNVGSEIPSEKIEDTSIFKEITGNDLISCPRKQKTDIVFRSYAKQIYSANKVPDIADMSYGFWERWILFNFPYIFVNKERYDDADDKAFLRIKDDDIVDKVTSREEISGLLNYAIGGLIRLRKQKKFSNETDGELIKSQWERKAQPLVYFEDEYIEREWDSYIEKSIITARIKEYCNKYQTTVPSKQHVNNYFKRDKGGYSDGKKKIGGESVWVWYNMRLCK